MKRMIAKARAQLADQDAWIKERRGVIDAALARLDGDFAKLMR